MTRTAWIPPDHRPDERQREDVRRSLHELVDQCVDAWPEILRQALEMGRGFPAGGTGGGRGSGMSPVEAQLERPGVDPARWAGEWLAEWSEAIAGLRNAGGHAKRVLPVDPATVERGRVNTVEVCAECSDPITDQVKRLDGQPYHRDSCWWRAYNRSRGRRHGPVDEAREA